MSLTENYSQHLLIDPPTLAILYENMPHVTAWLQDTAQLRLKLFVVVYFLGLVFEVKACCFPCSMYNDTAEK